MTSIIKFEMAHLRAIKAQPMQRDFFIYGDDLSDAMICMNPAVTLTDGSKVLGCGGMVRLPDYEVLWALLSAEAGRCMVQIYRLAFRMMALAERPVGATVRSDFRQGARMLRMLGMKKREDAPVIALGGVKIDFYVKEV